MLICHGLFRAEEVWFLEDNSEYKNRRLEIGVCPFCNNQILMLFQTNKLTGKTSYQRARDKKAKRLFKELKPQIDYKKSDIAKGSKSNMAYIYGKNEIRTINGEKMLIQKAVDFNGTEKIVKMIKIS